VRDGKKESGDGVDDDDYDDGDRLVERRQSTEDGEGLRRGAIEH
jgi:hypothetical protein